MPCAVAAHTRPLGHSNPGPGGRGIDSRRQGRSSLQFALAPAVCRVARRQPGAFAVGGAGVWLRVPWLGTAERCAVGCLARQVRSGRQRGCRGPCVHACMQARAGSRRRVHHHHHTMAAARPPCRHPLQRCMGPLGRAACTPTPPLWHQTRARAPRHGWAGQGCPGTCGAAGQACMLCGPPLPHWHAGVVPARLWTWCQSAASGQALLALRLSFCVALLCRPSLSLSLSLAFPSVSLTHGGRTARTAPPSHTQCCGARHHFMIIFFQAP